MKISKTVLLTLSLLGLSSFVQADKGEELVKNKCATCHQLTLPDLRKMNTFKAPPINAVLFHVKADYEDKEDAKNFIKKYVVTPIASKAVCESDKVTHYGVMPSLKGSVTEKELESITEHLMANYPTKEFVTMISKVQTNGKINGLQKSPFLMNQEELPHVTKLLVQAWDKEKLGLSTEQKTKLLVVRKETMSGVKRIKKALKTFEAEVIEMTVDDEDLKDIQVKVREVAKLKAEATMIHLKCIKDSLEILNDEQIEYLLPFWEA